MQRSARRKSSLWRQQYYGKCSESRQRSGSARVIGVQCNGDFMANKVMNESSVPLHSHDFLGCEYYNLNAGGFLREIMSPMNRPRYASEAQMVVLKNYDLLVMGGTYPAGDGETSTADVERYNLQDNVWILTSPMDQDRKWFQAVVLQNGMVLVIGGTARNNHGIRKELSSCELFDPETNFWSPAASMSQARSSLFGAEVLPSGEVIVFGGSNIGGYLATCEIYNPSANTWRTGSPLTAPYGVSDHIGARSYAQLDDGNIVVSPWRGLDNSNIVVSPRRRTQSS